MGYTRPSMAQNVSSPFSPGMFDKDEHCDIFISFHGVETLDFVNHGEEGMETKTFVHHYLAPALRDQWTQSGFEGDLHIFYNNIERIGNNNNSRYRAIAALQVRLHLINIVLVV